MTKEYNDAVKETLTEDRRRGRRRGLPADPDRLDRGRELWRAAVHTMRESFKYVVLLDPEGFPNPKSRHVFIVYGSDKPLDLAEVKAVAEEAYARQGGAEAGIHPHARPGRPGRTT